MYERREDPGVIGLISKKSGAQDGNDSDQNTKPAKSRFTRLFRKQFIRLFFIGGFLILYIQHGLIVGLHFFFTFISDLFRWNIGVGLLQSGRLRIFFYRS